MLPPYPSPVPLVYLGHARRRLMQAATVLVVGCGVLAGLALIACDAGAHEPNECPPPPSCPPEGMALVPLAPVTPAEQAVEDAIRKAEKALQGGKQ